LSGVLGLHPFIVVFLSAYYLLGYIRPPPIYPLPRRSGLSLQGGTLAVKPLGGGRAVPRVKRPPVSCAPDSISAAARARPPTSAPGPGTALQATWPLCLLLRVKPPKSRESRRSGSHGRIPPDGGHAGHRGGMAALSLARKRHPAVLAPPSRDAALSSGPYEASGRHSLSPPITR
jgi:hypothetical protein